MDLSIKREDLQLDKVCWICLFEEENLQVISEAALAKLIECAPDIQLPNDNFCICLKCENEINKWQTFRQQVVKAFEICAEIASKTSTLIEETLNNHEIKTETTLLKDDENETLINKYECTKCSQTFPTYGKLRTHMKIHKMEEGYSCDLCNKLFPTARNLWRHKRYHEANKPYPCSQCAKTFAFKHALDRHFQTKHVSVANFLCSYCPKKYKVKETLMSHIKKMHSGQESGAICNFCGKFCISMASLNVHLRSHTGERPFICDFCSKGFMTKDHLTLHRRIHTGERPFKCDDCGKSFISSSVLKKHQRSHTGERPYECHLCAKKFSLRSVFKSHLKCH